jgi:hypothetical protein
MSEVRIYGSRTLFFSKEPCGPWQTGSTLDRSSQCPGFIIFIILQKLDSVQILYKKDKFVTSSILYIRYEIATYLCHNMSSRKRC